MSNQTFIKSEQKEDVRTAWLIFCQNKQIEWEKIKRKIMHLS